MKAPFGIFDFKVLLLVAVLVLAVILSTKHLFLSLLLEVILTGPLASIGIFDLWSCYLLLLLVLAVIPYTTYLLFTLELEVTLTGPWGCRRTSRQLRYLYILFVT